MTGTASLPAPPMLDGNAVAAGELLVEHVVDRNQWGSPTVIKDDYGKETRITYGALGREWYRWHESGAWSKTRYYSSAGQDVCPAAGTATRVEKASTEPGWQFVTCLDVLGRTIRSSRLGFDGSSDLVVEDFEYNRTGALRWKSLPRFKSQGAEWIAYQHDFLGRRTSEVMPNGKTTATDYSTHPVPGMGSLKRVDVTVTVAGETDRVYVRTTNPLGQLDAVIDPTGAVVSYDYNNAGNLVRTVTVNNVLSQSEMIETTIGWDHYGHKTDTA